jgi:flagellar FliJ protein
MKKFEFRFQKVEEIRERRKQNALKALAESQQKLLNSRSLKETLLQSLHEAFLRRENFGVQSASLIGVVQSEENHIAGTKQRIIAVLHQIKRDEKEVERATKAFLEMQRELRVIEKLREKDEAEYSLERQKFLNHQIDDLNTMRHRLKEKE